MSRGTSGVSVGSLLLFRSLDALAVEVDGRRICYATARELGQVGFCDPSTAATRIRKLVKTGAVRRLGPGRLLVRRGWYELELQRARWKLPEASASSGVATAPES